MKKMLTFLFLIRDFAVTLSRKTNFNKTNYVWNCWIYRQKEGLPYSD